MMDFTILKPFAGNISRQAVFLLFRNRHPDAEENIKNKEKKRWKRDFIPSNLDG